MTVPVQAEIGPVYDLLLATRDASTLPCKNKDGQVVNLSAVAFMTSVNAQNQQHEETELQHKDQLIQLGSSNLIDREFDQWPQVSQGDWSGGMLQRILTGATPLTSFGAQSDPTRYWDGLGLVWPQTDRVPQRAFQTTYSDSGSAMTALNNNFDVAGGTLEGFSPGYCFCYVNNVPANILVYIDGAGNRHPITNATQIAGIVDLFMGHGAMWYTAPNGAGGTGLFYVNNQAGVLTATKLADVSTTSTTIPRCASAGTVGNRQYVAAATRTASHTNATSDLLVLYDVTNTNGVFNGAASIPLQMPLNWQITDTCFQGSTLYIAITDGTRTQLLAYAIAPTTFTTVAEVYESAVYMIASMNGLFLLGTHMYLFQSGSLQMIDRVPLQRSATQVLTGAALSRPSAVGPYVMFTGLSTSSGPTTTVTIYAYNVVLGRMFKFDQETFNFSGGALSALGPRMAALSGFSRGSVPVTSFAAGAATSAMPSAAATTNVAEFGLLESSTIAARAPISAGMDLISSIIDFTSAQPKLFRSVKVTFPALVANQGVTVNVWLDQDVGFLAAAPDFTASTTNPGDTSLVVRINAIHRKLVYELITTTTGSSLGAPLPQDISVQAATGWTRTHILDLADNVMVNSKSPGDTCWSHQSVPNTPAVDATAAYNFLRQLWRLKGGECSATFPNGDAPADWLLQDLHFDSPKPFALSFRSDIRTGGGYICTIKLREDI